MTPRVEAKVKWSAFWAYVGSTAALWLLQGLAGDPSIIPALPDAVEPFLIALLPTLTTAVAGWRTKHTPRPDLPMAQR
jgi:hypothetical protein